VLRIPHSITIPNLPHPASSHRTIDYSHFDRTANSTVVSYTTKTTRVLRISTPPTTNPNFPYTVSLVSNHRLQYIK
jgi:hypothetical protein